MPQQRNQSEFAEARKIANAVRDVNLQLDEDTWPPPDLSLQGWQPAPSGFTRVVVPGRLKSMRAPIRETLLRFPSAPIHGWQRLHEYHVNLPWSENFHTYRVLSNPDRSEPVNRIFLLHNGLNETSSMGLYYQLASHIVYAAPATVCVLRPFPGHLTRFPFPAFGETPLHRYLWDGSHLFRQFLRYMVETQWFLSTIVRRSTYRSLSGANLLCEHDDPSKSRVSGSILADGIGDRWRALHAESERIIEETTAGDKDVAKVRPAPVADECFLQSVQSLRQALQLNCYPTLNGDLQEDDGEPSVHVVGYSLGGFTAQSVFMSWPFLIASSSTLLSGGALRELSPTAFAHPEEWQTVLHSLRYELDEALISGVHGDDSRHVDGMEEDLFLYLRRTFYEVFQQEYRGSFQSRLEAFRQRMLFVVGGNDPIVQTRSVLDSGPPGGLNMLTIGGLGHFLDGRARDDEEQEQRSFWLPEVAQFIQRFGRHAENKQAEERPYTWVDDEMQFIAYPPTLDGDEATGGTHDSTHVRRLSVSERLTVNPEGALPAPIFERHLEDLLARQVDQSAAGLLLILRNEIPAMFLDDHGIYEHAMMLNHDDVSIARYVRGMRARRNTALKARDRVALILPWNVRRVHESMDIHRGYPSQAEAAKGALPAPKYGAKESSRSQVGWSDQFSACKEMAKTPGQDSVRIFDGRKSLSRDIKKLANISASQIDQIPSLPDVWVWLSKEFLGLGEDEVKVPGAIKKLQAILPVYCETESAIDGWLRQDKLRVIIVSRARYNPRFMGRLITEPREAERLLVHAAVCASASEKLGKKKFASLSNEDRKLR